MRGGHLAQPAQGLECWSMAGLQAEDPAVLSERLFARAGLFEDLAQDEARLRALGCLGHRSRCGLACYVASAQLQQRCREVAGSGHPGGEVSMPLAIEGLSQQLRGLLGPPFQEGEVAELSTRWA